MKKSKSSILVVFLALMSLIGAAILLGQGCGSGKVEEQQASTANVQMAPNLPGAPAKALFGQYYKDRTNRLWIYDGAQWVPHDSTVDSYYQQSASTKYSTALKSMTIDEMKTAPCTTADGSGAHPKHASFDCKVCHMVGGVMCFDPAGPATGTGTPPSFDVTAKTCSNIKCHGVPAGTFSFYFPDGTGEPALNTVNIYGNPGGTTPSWYSTGISCTACHADPPRNGTDGSNAWHSGYHGGQGPTGANNQCQLCHPDASSPGNGIGDTITNPILHANGVYNVQASFKSTCFNCH